MKIDKSIIKELSDYLEEFNLTEIEITEKDTKIKVSKNNVSISNQPANPKIPPVAISLIKDLCLNSSLLYIFDICNSIIGFLNRSRASLIATEV